MKKMEIFIFTQFLIVTIMLIVVLVVNHQTEVRPLTEEELEALIPRQELRLEYEYAKTVEEEAHKEQETLTTCSVETPLVIPVQKIYYYEEIPLSQERQYQLLHICNDLNLSPSVALAFIESESGFDENAIGSLGEVGLMQVNPINFERMMIDYGLHVEDSKLDSMNAGLIILKELIDKYHELDHVTMCYKCGESRGNELLDSGTRLEVCDTIIERTMYWESVLNE